MTVDDIRSLPCSTLIFNFEQRISVTWDTNSPPLSEWRMCGHPNCLKIEQRPLATSMACLLLRGISQQYLLKQSITVKINRKLWLLSYCKALLGPYICKRSICTLSIMLEVRTGFGGGADTSKLFISLQVPVHLSKVSCTRCRASFIKYVALKVFSSRLAPTLVQADH